MGGSALGAYYVLNHTPPRIDALAPDNVLTMCVSAPTRHKLNALGLDWVADAVEQVTPSAV